MLQTEKLKSRHYILAFSFTVVIAVLLLCLSCFMPQSWVLENIRDSIGGFQSEGYRPNSYDHQESALLDTYTDVTMLQATASAHKDNLLSVFTNDLNYFDGSESIIEDLEMYASGIEGDRVTHYVRYWMGFRVLLRILLSFINYFQIRRYLGFLFFCLLFALVFYIQKHTDTVVASLFALSIIMVRPNVIVSSLQFSCCFFIAFASMFMIPWLYRNPKWEQLFFMEIGMITMYFDFYTVPLITFGYPLVFLLVMQARNRETVSIKRILELFGCWLAGWCFMWIAKLALTTLFTDINAFSNGFGSFMARVGITKDQNLIEYYSLSLAAAELFKAVFCDLEGAVISGIAASLCVAAVVFRARKMGISPERFLRYKYFLLVALIPMVWFVITAQPIAIHAFFQYRSVAIIYWSLGAYIYMVFYQPKSI